MQGETDITIRKHELPEQRRRSASSSQTGALLIFCGGFLSGAVIAALGVGFYSYLHFKNRTEAILQKEQSESNQPLTEATVQSESDAPAQVPAAESLVPDPGVPEVRTGELVQRGPDVIDPTCLECPSVQYPDAARRAKLEGVVRVSFVITETGAVENIKIEESGGQIFDQAVIKGVKGWRFQPATKNGVRVKVLWQRRFRFSRSPPF